jgi:hypothetical protein
MPCFSAELAPGAFVTFFTVAPIRARLNADKTRCKSEFTNIDHLERSNRHNRPWYHDADSAKRFRPNAAREPPSIDILDRSKYDQQS